MKEQTPEICLAAVQKTGLVLLEIENQTLPIAIAALKQNPKSRKFLDDKFRTPQVYKAAGYDYKPEDLVPLHNNVERRQSETRHAR